MTDAQLIARHAGGDSEAFSELVRRHGGWVYGVARRCMGDPHLAEDVTQAVFLVLARDAGRLRSDTMLPAWLFRVTQYASVRALRGETRRRRHESEAATMQTPPPADGWDDLTPILDEMVGRLRQSDREAILLRFYRQLSFAEVGAILGITEEAARKRVNRALAKVREMAAAKGLTMPAAAMAALLWTHLAAEGALPPGLVATVTTCALGNASTAAAMSESSVSLANGVAAMMTWAKAKTAAAIVGWMVLAGGVGTGLMTQLLAEDGPPTTQPAPAAALDQQRIQGHWRFVEVWDQGRLLPPEDVPQAVVEIDGRRLVRSDGAGERVVVDLALHPNTQPMQIDFIDPASGQVTMVGICELTADGKMLSLNMTESADSRPTAFAGSYFVLQQATAAGLRLRSDAAAAREGQFHWQIERRQPVRLFYADSVFVTPDGQVELRGGHGELVPAAEPVGAMELRGAFSTPSAERVLVKYRLWRTNDPVPALRGTEADYPGGGVAQGIRTTSPRIIELGREYVSIFESELVQDGRHIGTWYFLIRVAGDDEDPLGEPDLGPWLARQRAE